MQATWYENRLHWIKDVILGKDAASLSNHNAATNWSIIRNIAINLARQGGYDSLTKAERFLTHDIDKLFLPSTMNHPWGELVP